MAREIAVAAEGQLAHEEVAHRVDAVFLDQLRRGDDVLQPLRHLLAFDGPPAMGEDAPWRLKAGGHEESRPINRVKPQDILTYYMNVCRPKC